MPLELGIFLGAKRFGVGRQRRKTCIILDTERFRYQKFISDIAGQDPREHKNDPLLAAKALRNFLVPHANGKSVSSARVIKRRYNDYSRELPYLCRERHWDRLELTFNEKVELMYRWIKATPL